MKILVQRVSEASVSVDSEIVSSIGEGACVFVGFDPQDNDETCLLYTSDAADE